MYKFVCGKILYLQQLAKVLKNGFTLEEKYDIILSKLQNNYKRFQIDIKSKVNIHFMRKEERVMRSKARKIISVIAAAALLLTSGIIFGTTSKANAGDAVLQQYDSEWGSYPYGDGTLGDSGCGAFAIINAVRYLTGNTMDIYSVADWGSENEYIWGVGSSFSIAPDAAAKFGSTYGFQLDTHIGFDGYVGSSYPATPEAYDSAWNTLVSKLSQGEVAVGLVHNHFISIVDYDSATNCVLVYDPGAGSKRQTTRSGDWKTYDELNYWSDAGSEYLKLRAYLTFYFATGTSSPTINTTLPAFSGTADAAGTYIVTTGSGDLNLRAASSTSSAIIDRIPNGSEVQVIESDGSWASVVYNGISGYCSMEYLTPASQSTDTVSTTIPETSETTSVTTTTSLPLSEENAGKYIVSAGGSYLNMRAGTGMTFDIVAQIPDGSEVTVTSANNEWAAVTWKNNTGYCALAYLEKSDESPVTTKTTTETVIETTASAETNVSAENTEPETSTTFAETTTETVLTTISNAETTTPSPSDKTDKAGAYRVITDGSYLNLRAESSMNAKILAQIPNNTEVFVISSDGDWYNVSWKDTIGYCRAEYLEKVIIAADQSTESINNIDPAFVTAYGDANLDGKVDMSDVVLIHKALTGAISLNNTAAANADCYLDGRISIVDVTVIIQYIIQNCSLPVNPVV